MNRLKLWWLKNVTYRQSKSEKAGQAVRATLEIEAPIDEYLKGNALCKYYIHKVSYKFGVVKIYTSRPGIVIGRKGELYFKLLADLQRRFHNPNLELKIIDYKPL